MSPCAAGYTYYTEGNKCYDYKVTPADTALPLLTTVVAEEGKWWNRGFCKSCHFAALSDSYFTFTGVKLSNNLNLFLIMNE